MSKQWIQPKRPGEMADTSRISKAAKIQPKDIKIKVEVKQHDGQIAN